MTKTTITLARELKKATSGIFQNQKNEMYWDYVAWCNMRQEDPAGMTTFLKVFNKVYNVHLAFRDKMEHAECDICNYYKKQIKRVTTDASRKELR